MSAPAKPKPTAAIVAAYQAGEMVSAIARRFGLHESTIRTTLITQGVYIAFRDSLHTAETYRAHAATLNGEALEARIAADQARIHGRRIAALRADYERYKLPRMGKLPEWMAA